MQRRVFFFLILALVVCIIRCNKRDELSFTCRVEGKYVELSASYPAKVKRIAVEEGSNVKNGEVIIELDTEDMEIELRSIGDEIESSLHQIEKLKALLSYIRKNLDRSRELEKAGGASRMNVEELELKEKTTEEEIRSLNKKISAGITRKELLEKKIKDGKITSPKDGRVVEITVDEGEVAIPSLILVKVELKGEKYLRCYASESALDVVKVDREVDVKKGKHFLKGKIYFISSEPEFTPRYFVSDSERDILHYEFRVKIPDESGFNTGEFVKVSLPK